MVFLFEPQSRGISALQKWLSDEIAGFVTLALLGFSKWNWFNFVQCVSSELFPVLSVTMGKCIQEKLESDIGFKLNDFRDETVKDVFERLMEKRTMNNKEIQYLKRMIVRIKQKC